MVGQVLFYKHYRQQKTRAMKTNPGQGVNVKLLENRIVVCTDLILGFRISKHTLTQIGAASKPFQNDIKEHQCSV